MLGLKAILEKGATMGIFELRISIPMAELWGFLPDGMLVGLYLRWKVRFIKRLLLFFQLMHIISNDYHLPPMPAGRNDGRLFSFFRRKK